MQLLPITELASPAFRGGVAMHSRDGVCYTANQYPPYDVYAVDAQGHTTLLFKASSPVSAIYATERYLLLFGLSEVLRFDRETRWTTALQREGDDVMRALQRNVVKRGMEIIGVDDASRLHRLDISSNTAVHTCSDLPIISGARAVCDSSQPDTIWVATSGPLYHWSLTTNTTTPSSVESMRDLYALIRMQEDWIVGMTALQIIGMRETTMEVRVVVPRLPLMTRDPPMMTGNGDKTVFFWRDGLFVGGPIWLNTTLSLEMEPTGVRVRATGVVHGDVSFSVQGRGTILLALDGGGEAFCPIPRLDRSIVVTASLPGAEDVTAVYPRRNRY